MRIVIFLFILFQCFTAQATLIPQPPITREKSTAEQEYLRVLYDNHNVLEVVTSAPNGSRKDFKGRIVSYLNHIWMNTDGNKTWVQQ